jgi:hypothetical protein
MQEIKDKKLAKQIAENPICKERFESALKKACGKPATKPSARRSKR